MNNKKEEKSVLRDIGKTVNKIMTSVGKETAKIIGFELEKQRQGALVKACFGEDKYKKIMALAKLRKEFPELYAEVKKELK